MSGDGAAVPGEGADGVLGRRTMRAVVRRAYGSADALRVEDVPIPSPGRGEVLIRVAAAGLDRGAWHLMRGVPPAVRLVTGMSRPRPAAVGIGAELAGTVVRVGPGVDEVRPGDEVVGTGRAAFAEYALASASKVLPRPAAISVEAAATLPISGITAREAVVRVGRVRPGDRVLVIGAAGGVGSLAVQFAAAAGASVTAVCSGAKADAVRTLGATEVIDRHVAAIGSLGRHDLVIDIGGLRGLRELRSVVAPSGSLVLVGGEGGRGPLGGVGRQVLGYLRSLVVPPRVRMIVAPESAGHLAPALEAVVAGRVAAVVDRVVDLDGVASGMRAMEAGGLVGKVVIRP